jgi:hypothetical protein
MSGNSQYNGKKVTANQSQIQNVSNSRSSQYVSNFQSVIHE